MYEHAAQSDTKGEVGDIGFTARRNGKFERFLNVVIV